MSFALLQNDLSIPPLDKLKRAFRAVKFLTELDAHTLGEDAFGILVKNLSAEHAALLHGALQAEGIGTEIADERSLPPLPPTKFVKRLDCRADALMIYDPMGRSFPLQWGHILLLAAGQVRLNDFKRIQTRVPVTRYDSQGHPHEEVVTETRTKEQLNFHLVLEIILTRAVLRYTVKADEFNFAGLGARKTADVPQNFALLVRDLAQFAPQAALNRGAVSLRDNTAEAFSYPSKNAFVEEIVWMLWRMTKAGP